MPLEPEILVKAVFIGVFTVCALTDFWLLRIPNVLVAVLVLLFAIAAWYWSDRIVIWQHLAVAAAVFALGTVLFIFRQFGGGDVKLLGAAALWAGFAGLPVFVLSLGIAGLILLVVYQFGRNAMMTAAMYIEHVSNGRLPTPRSLTVATHIPYGIVIAAAAIAASRDIPMFQ